MNPIFITNKIAAALTPIERARGFLEAATLSDDWIKKMGHRALILEAHHTTHIEGTQLTLEQSTSLIDGGKVPEADPDDARELLNYRKAFDFVSAYVGERLLHHRRANPGNSQAFGERRPWRQGQTRRIPQSAKLCRERIHRSGGLHPAVATGRSGAHGGLDDMA